MLDSPVEYHRMAQVEESHWWYRALHALVGQTLQQQALPCTACIVDAGCGTGGLLQYLQRAGYSHATGFDLSPHALNLARQRGQTVFQADIRHMARHFAPASLDVIVANDVFYFLSRDELSATLVAMYSLLRPGGLVVANLPALALFQGIHDRAVGISRRFSLVDTAWMATLTPLEIHRRLYWPFLLAPAMAVVRGWQRQKLAWGEKPPIRSDVALPPPWLNALLFRLVSWENRRLSWKPLASSLFLVLRNPGLPSGPVDIKNLCRGPGDHHGSLVG